MALVGRSIPLIKSKETGMVTQLSDANISSSKDVWLPGGDYLFRPRPDRIDI